MKEKIENLIKEIKNLEPSLANELSKELQSIVSTIGQKNYEISAWKKQECLKEFNELKVITKMVEPEFGTYYYDSDLPEDEGDEYVKPVNGTCYLSSEEEFLKIKELVNSWNRIRNYNVFGKYEGPGKYRIEPEVDYRCGDFDLTANFKKDEEK